METKIRFKHKSISPFLLVMLSFIIVILVGSFFICTPWAQTNGKWGNYVDALFTATSATCVTGLVSYGNGVIEQLTFFGQFVVMICIQIGGLGFITIFAFIVTLFKKKMQMKDRYLLAQAVGSESMFDLSKFVRKIMLISLIFEVSGFLLSLPAFWTVIEDKSWATWTSIFHSVSAYNNAGFDLFGTQSFIRGPENPLITAMPEWAYNYILCVTMFLIISGGISFMVVIETVTSKKKPKQWSAFTKMVLIMTPILIIGGACTFMLTDKLNSANPMSIMDCFFQSVTLRTAGFASYDQSQLSEAGTAISCFLMFTGAAPLSTGGGIKVTTMCLIFVAMYSYLRGRKVVAFNRLFKQKTVLKAVSLMILAFLVIVLTFVFTDLIETAHGVIPKDKHIYLLYESFSAFGTVGVSKGVTPMLHWGSKLFIILEMYIGRLGPITFFNIFHKNTNIDEENSIRYVAEDCLIG